MQLFALDASNQLISTLKATKQTNYRCIECQSIVRLRAGEQRQAHFYHVEPNRQCHLSGKSMEHLQAQCYLQNQLPPGECHLEWRFDEINRIADVVWLPKKIVFEIQCSPITAEEIKKRNNDYKKIGFQTIWIFHDDRYNKWKATAAEVEMLHRPHYFTNIDSDGKGMIYDQYHYVAGGLRHYKQSPLPIKIHSLQIFTENKKITFTENLNKKINTTLIYFNGDFCDVTLRENEYAQQALNWETNFKKNLKPPKSKSIFQKVASFYNIFLRMLLEWACK